MRRLVSGAVLLAATVAVLIPASAAAADRDCPDFSSQAAAQSFFLNHGGPQRDPHRLDEDGDGLACETNSSPYRGLLTIRYADAANAFRGRLKSVSAACESGRMVRVFKQRDGRDRLVGSDTSNQGRYQVNKRNAGGRYYARSTSKGQCLAERSRTIRVR